MDTSRSRDGDGTCKFELVPTHPQRHFRTAHEGMCVWVLCGVKNQWRGWFLRERMTRFPLRHHLKLGRKAVSAVSRRFVTGSPSGTRTHLKFNMLIILHTDAQIATDAPAGPARI